MDKPRWLSATGSPEDFPPASAALREPNGLLAVGGNLEPDWLLAAYVRGIFPWYEAGQPILWWSPDPRAILLPDELHVSRRLKRTIRKTTVRMSADTSFAAVIEACAAPRVYTDDTWITPQMRDAYVTMHRLGWAHSFEAWDDDELIGGLYGLAIGDVFFGESMFSRRTDASKIAFVNAVAYLRDCGFRLIDCQVWSHHLRTLGARTMPREQFLALLNTLCDADRRPGSWCADYEKFVGSSA
ncbi:MAG: leucyl/phenylalanyl-tRNA--protein transferase [Gammaproteobacteria bacterium]|nr:leucyl/phenylalanyl-tRNA--protein transferase [Gammaproteobacteria bacterium]